MSRSALPASPQREPPVSRAVVTAALVGALVTVLIGIPLAFALNVWIDEAFSLHTTAAGVASAWREAIRFEDQPPLYFALEAAWRLIDETSVGFARLPSVICVAAGVAIVVVTAGRVAPQMPPLAVALCTAINAIAVWASVEMRVYPLVFLEAAILGWAFVAGFCARVPSRPAQIIYALTAVAGLYTQYFVGFLLLGHGLTLLVARRELRAYVVAMIPVSLAFVPFVPVVRYHLSANRDQVARMSVVHVVHEFANTIFAYVLPHETQWSGSIKVAGFCAAALLTAALLVWGRPRLERAARLTLAAWLSSALTFAAALALTGGDPYFRRHLIVLAPAAIVLSYAVVAGTARGRRPLAIAAAVVYAAFAATALAAEYRPPLAKLGEWQRVARTVDSAGPIPVAVFPAELALPLAVYRPNGTTVPLPVAMPFDPSYVDVRPLRDTAAVARALATLPAADPRLWVVTEGPCSAASADFNFNCRYLERYLAQHARLRSERDFRGAQVRLYERIVTRTP